MPTKVKEVQPPRGLSRVMYRLPIWLFRVHLGWLGRGRFMLLIHTGRKSGLPRQSVVEVIGHDKGSDTCYAFSGFGGKSDWIRNIEKNPKVIINAGHGRFNAVAEQLPPEQAEQKILEYAKRYPVAIRVLPRMMGYHVDGTEEDFRAFARLGIVVAFHPVSALPQNNSM